MRLKINFVNLDCDNQSALHLVAIQKIYNKVNIKFHSMIDIMYHKKNLTRENLWLMQFILADLWTKIISLENFKRRFVSMQVLHDYHR